jgi:hypothetical protein
MDRVDTQLSSFVLAQIEWKLDRISKEQHRLARKKALLREQASRLRLGELPTRIRLPAREVMAAGGRDARRAASRRRVDHIEPGQ